MQTDKQELERLESEFQSIMDEFRQLTGNEEEEGAKAAYGGENPYSNPDDVSDRRMERAEDDRLDGIMEKIRSGEPLDEEEEQALEVALEAARGAEKAEDPEDFMQILSKIQSGEGLSDEEEQTFVEYLEAMRAKTSQGQKAAKSLRRFEGSRSVQKAVTRYLRAIEEADEVLKNYSPEAEEKGRRRPEPILRGEADDRLMKDLLDKIEEKQHPGSPNPTYGNHPLVEHDDRASVLKSLFPDWAVKSEHTKRETARKASGSEPDTRPRSEEQVKKSTDEKTGHDLRKERKAGVREGLKTLFGG